MFIGQVGVDVSVGILGTGVMGTALAARFAGIGEEVYLGSRDEGRAKQTLDDLVAKHGEGVASITPSQNKKAAEQDFVFLCVPWTTIPEIVPNLAESLRGHTVVSVANPLQKIGDAFISTDMGGGSIAEQTQTLLPDSPVVAALHHVPAGALARIAQPVNADVLTVGDDAEANQRVRDLLNRISGMRAFDAGPLSNAGGLERMSAAVLTVNIRHRIRASWKMVET